MSGREDRGRDPLDELRAAWRGLEAPPPDRELADEDERTREVLAWVRAAWSQLEPSRPARAPGPRPLSARPRRWASPRPWIGAAAAAAVLAALLALAARLAGPDGAGAPRSDDVAHDADALPPGGRGAAPGDAGTDADLGPEAPPDEPVEPVRVARVDETQLELSYGTVRLVLLDRPSRSARAPGPETNSESRRQLQGD